MPEDDFLSRMPKDMDEKTRQEKADQLRKYVEEGRQLEKSRNEYKKTPGLTRVGGVGGDGGDLERGMMGSRFRPLNKAKGGKVSSASKRADGCCIKGKTKGRMV